MDVLQESDDSNGADSETNVKHHSQSQCFPGREKVTTCTYFSHADTKRDCGDGTEGTKTTAALSVPSSSALTVRQSNILHTAVLYNSCTPAYVQKEPLGFTVYNLFASTE